MIVVVAAVGMWESPQRFPRAGEWVGKQFYRFPMLSTDRHFHGQYPERTISARWGGTASTGQTTTNSARDHQNEPDDQECEAVRVRLTKEAGTSTGE